MACSFQGWAGAVWQDHSDGQAAQAVICSSFADDASILHQIAPALQAPERKNY